MVSHEPRLHLVALRAARYHVAVRQRDAVFGHELRDDLTPALRLCVGRAFGTRLSPLTSSDPRRTLVLSAPEAATGRAARLWAYGHQRPSTYCVSERASYGGVLHLCEQR